MKDKRVRTAVRRTAVLYYFTDYRVHYIPGIRTAVYVYLVYYRPTVVYSI